MNRITEKLETVGRDFCKSFLTDPYLCYTEHGQHAYFYRMLYAELTEKERYTEVSGRRICVLQKEYPTATNLGKKKRQHWDISVIKESPKPCCDRLPLDFLKLQAVAEFGLNADKKHLVDDVKRLCHRYANVEDKFVFHLYRLSDYEARPSKRDRSPKSTCIIDVDEAATIVGKEVTLFYAVSNTSELGEPPTRAWIVKDGKCKEIEN